MSTGDRDSRGSMRNCAASCKYEMAALDVPLARPEGLLTLRRHRTTAHLAPQVVDAQEPGERGEGGEVGRGAEVRDQGAHHDRAQRRADTVESEQRTTRSHHLRGLEMIVDMRHPE